MAGGWYTALKTGARRMAVRHKFTFTATLRRAIMGIKEKSRRASRGAISGAETNPVRDAKR
jgi:hypothetical protein